MRTIRTIALLVMVVLAYGCMPNMKRFIPENKSAHIEVFSPLYGYIVVDTRVVGDTNSPLPEMPVGKSINIK